jgi:hypothetical protein
MCGDSGLTIKMQRWLETEREFDIAADQREKTFGLFVADSREVFGVVGHFELVPLEGIDGRCVVQGGGSEIALGAMLAGASAIDAIRIVERASDMARDVNWVEVGRADTPIQPGASFTGTPGSGGDACRMCGKPLNQHCTKHGAPYPYAGSKAMHFCPC